MDQAPRTEAAHPVRLVVVLLALLLSATTLLGSWHLYRQGWSLWPAVGTGVALLATVDSWIAATRPGAAWPVWVHLVALS